MPSFEVELELEEKENPLSISFWNLENVELTGSKNEIRGFTTKNPLNTPDLYAQGGFGTFERNTFFGEASFFGSQKRLFLHCDVRFLSRDVSMEYLLPKGKGVFRIKDGNVVVFELQLKADKKSQKLSLFKSSEKTQRFTSKDLLSEN
jgi:hypothetical protein